MTIAHHSLSFVAGFLVRPCCVIPAALALLGAGGAGMAATLAPYRPWFLLAAAAFFSVSFYWNFIRNRNRAGMVVWALSALVAGALLLGPEVPAKVEHDTQEKEKLMMNTTNAVSHAEIPVEGMACKACARRLERVLGDLPGVTEASVEFGAKRARITYDNGQTDLTAVAERIGKAGFRADVERIKDQ